MRIFFVAILLSGVAAGISPEDLPVHQEALKKALAAPALLDDAGDQQNQRADDESKKLRRLKSLTDRCPATIDIVINQDTTGSLSGRNLNNIKTELRSAFQAMEATYPGSRFGLANFEDIPMSPFGKTNNTCYEKVFRLDSNIDAFISSFNSLTLAGGKDYPESQYTALMSSALDTQMGYRGDTDSGTRVAKIILTITDSIAHVEGDGSVWGLLSNPGTYPLECDRHDYPSFDQIVSALENRKAIPAFFVLERSGPVGFPNPVPVYEEFVDLVMDGYGSVTKTTSFNNIEDQILDAIDLAMKLWCDKDPEVTNIPGITGEENCLTHDVLFVRDRSDSLVEDIKNMKKFVQDYVDGTAPGSTFGLVSHSDKPIEPFGYPMSLDYCYWKHSDLTTKEDFLAAYDEADSNHRSGGDFPENQLDATIRGVSDMKWTQENSNCNCVVLLTDAFYHEAGDFPSGTVYDPATDLCETADYPTVEQLATALIANKVGCVTVATTDVVLEFWTQFEMDLREFGFTGSFFLESPEPTVLRLSASFATQPKKDLRHLQPNYNKALPEEDLRHLQPNYNKALPEEDLRHLQRGGQTSLH